MKDIKFRTLRADEIEIRVGTVKKDGATLLLYQDGRCAMNILDETVGAFNWQRDHKELKGRMYAGVGIWDEDKAQFIWKWDCGTESNTEREKGEASDGLKRAVVNWGIARELYSCPTIKINCPTQPKQGGRGYELKNPWQFYGARVSRIGYSDDRKIIDLQIVDQNGRTIYEWTGGNPVRTESRTTEQEIGTIKEMLGQLYQIGYGNIVNDTLRKYRLNSIDEMRRDQYRDMSFWLSGLLQDARKAGA